MLVNYLPMLNLKTLSTEQLLLLHFVKKHPEIWNTTLRVDSTLLKEAWIAVACEICKDSSDNCVNKLQLNFGRLLNENSLKSAAVGDMMIKRTDLPDVTTYGNAVGFDVNLFNADEDNAIEAIAKMRRVYEAKRGLKRETETIRSDQDGFKKWGFLKIGGTLDDLRTYFGDVKVVDNKATEDLQIPPKAKRLPAEISREPHAEDRNMYNNGAKNRSVNTSVVQFSDPIANPRGCFSTTSENYHNDEPLNPQYDSHRPEPNTVETASKRGKSPIETYYDESGSTELLKEYGDLLDDAQKKLDKCMIHPIPPKKGEYRSPSSKVFDKYKQRKIVEDQQKADEKLKVRRIPMKEQEKPKFFHRQKWMEALNLRRSFGPESVVEQNFLDSKGVPNLNPQEEAFGEPKKGEDYISRKAGDFEDVVAYTNFGTFQTEDANTARTLSWLNDSKNLNYLQRVVEKIARSRELSRCEEDVKTMMLIEDNFVRDWKRENIGKPLHQLNPVEIRFIVLKSNGFDLIDQKYLEDSLREEEKNWKSDERRGLYVSTAQGGFYEHDSETAFALNWLNKPENRDPLMPTPLDMLYMAKNKFVRNTIGRMIGLEHEFVEKAAKEIASLSVDFIASEREIRRPNDRYERLTFTKEKRAYVRKRLDEEEKEMIHWTKLMSLPGAPKNKDELYFWLQIIGMERAERSHQTGHYADYANIKTDDRGSSKAISWLHNPENATKVAETKKKLQTGAKLCEMDKKIMKKLKTERSFVEQWRDTNFRDRTDFEITLIAPDEFAFVQKKLKEYREETEVVRNAANSSHLAGSVEADVALYRADAIELGVEQVAEELLDDDFEYTGDSSSTSFCEVVSGLGPRTQNLIRKVNDVLSELERTNPAEYQKKQDAILRLMKLH